MSKANECKKNPLHDQYFDCTPNNSVNHRLTKDDLPPLFYGFCLIRLIHFIHALRWADPSQPILISKADFKSAYRRGTMRGGLAAMCTTMLCGFALILRCLPFGGSHCPNLWCIVSETITDLANDILSCPEWDENDLCSPHLSKLNEPERLDSSAPFGQARAADVVVHPNHHGKVDGFIDDLMTMGWLPAG